MYGYGRINGIRIETNGRYFPRCVLRALTHIKGPFLIRQVWQHVLECSSRQSTSKHDRIPLIEHSNFIKYGKQFLPPPPPWSPRMQMPAWPLDSYFHSVKPPQLKLGVLQANCRKGTGWFQQGKAVAAGRMESIEQSDASTERQGLPEDPEIAAVFCIAEPHRLQELW